VGLHLIGAFAAEPSIGACEEDWVERAAAALTASPMAEESDLGEDEPSSPGDEAVPRATGWRTVPFMLLPLAAVLAFIAGAAVLLMAGRPTPPSPVSLATPTAEADVPRPGVKPATPSWVLRHEASGSSAMPRVRAARRLQAVAAAPEVATAAGPRREISQSEDAYLRHSP
jgi:hypothetical protein